MNIFIPQYLVYSILAWYILVVVIMFFTVKEDFINDLKNDPFEEKLKTIFCYLFFLSCSPVIAIFVMLGWVVLFINNHKAGFRFTIGRDADDCEKLVLPAIVFINTNHSSFEEDKTKGFLICIGWWDFSVKIGMLFD